MSEQIAHAMEEQLTDAEGRHGQPVLCAAREALGLDRKASKAL